MLNFEENVYQYRYFQSPTHSLHGKIIFLNLAVHLMNGN